MKKQRFDELAQDVSDEDFKDFVGIKAYNFLGAKNKLASGKNSDDFSFAALLFGGFYGAYYKYWTPMITFTVGVLAIVILVEDAENHENYSKGLTLLLSIFWGVYFNASYVKHSYKKIAQLKKMEDDPARLKVLLGKKGGTSILHLILSLFLAGLVGMLLFADGN